MGHANPIEDTALNNLNYNCVEPSSLIAIVFFKHKIGICQFFFKNQLYNFKNVKIINLISKYFVFCLPFHSLLFDF